MPDHNNFGGDPFGMGDQEFLRLSLAQTDPFQAVREAVENARQAGATIVDIFIDEQSRVVVADNGSGMTRTELVEYMSKFGAGARTRGKGKNLGVGLKVSAMLGGLNGVTIMSRSFEHGGKYNQVVLGLVGKGQYGLQHQSRGGDKVKEIPKPYNGVYSTVVVIGDLQADAVTLVKYLNQRFLRLDGCLVRVLQEGQVDGKKSVWTTCDGLLACLAKVSSKTGSATYQRATLHWGIRKTPVTRDLKEVYDTEWSAPPLSYAFNGETFRSWTINHSSMLSHWGVRAGDRELIFVIEALGENVQIKWDRCSLEHWDEDAARDEVGKALPELVQAFMQVFEAENFEPNTQTENALVSWMLDSVLDRIRGGHKGENPVDPKKVTKSERERNGSGGGGGGGSGGNGRPGRRSGIPGYSFVNTTAIGSHAVQYDAANHRLLINREAPQFTKALESAQGQQQMLEARAQIAMGVIVGWATHWTQYGEEPSQEVLDASFGTSAANVFMYMSTQGSRSLTDRMKRDQRKKS